MLILVPAVHRPDPEPPADAAVRRWAWPSRCSSIGYLSHTWVTSNYAMGSVALVTIPIMTLVSGQLATTVLDQERRAQTGRLELAAQVSELSARW